MDGAQHVGAGPSGESAGELNGAWSMSGDFGSRADTKTNLQQFGLSRLVMKIVDG